VQELLTANTSSAIRLINQNLSFKHAQNLSYTRHMKSRTVLVQIAQLTASISAISAKYVLVATFVVVFRLQ
jgi:hypothetical protein